MATSAATVALVEHELYHIAQKKDLFGAPAFTRLWMLIFCSNQMGNEWCVTIAGRVSGTVLQWIKRDERTAFRARGLAIILRRAHRWMRSPKLPLVNFTNKHLAVSIQDT